MAKQETPSEPARRRYTSAFKNDIVQRCLQPGASVSGIALENGINANVLFRWRREHLHRRGVVPALGAGRAVLLPVEVGSSAPSEPQALASSYVAAQGVIEIDIGAARVRLRGPVDEASVRCVLHTLRAIA